MSAEPVSTKPSVCGKTVGAGLISADIPTTGISAVSANSHARARVMRVSSEFDSEVQADRPRRRGDLRPENALDAGGRAFADIDDAVFVGQVAPIERQLVAPDAVCRARAQRTVRRPAGLRP